MSLSLPEMGLPTDAEKAVINPSLLRPWYWDFGHEYNPAFDLGMSDWTVDEPLELNPVLQGKENAPSCESGDQRSTATYHHQRGPTNLCSPS